MTPNRYRLGTPWWRPFATLASEFGFELALPDLTDVATAQQPRWKHFVEAAGRWPTESRDSSHMSIYTDPRQVLEAVVGLAGRLRA